MSFGEIAALTIHDVKNRLAQLAGRAEQNGDTETVRTALEAAETLTTLLAFYKSENGILGLAVDANSPSDLLQELAGEIRGLGNISVLTESEDAPTLWFYDETLVRMVLANALHNALRYARSTIHLSAIESDGQLEFAVRDDGDGYPEAVLADGGGSAHVSREGTGLGLRLAHRVAEMHENAGQRGAIRLSNADGAVFSLYLPK